MKRSKACWHNMRGSLDLVIDCQALLLCSTFIHLARLPSLGKKYGFKVFSLSESPYIEEIWKVTSTKWSHQKVHMWPWIVLDLKERHWDPCESVKRGFQLVSVLSFAGNARSLWWTNMPQSLKLDKMEAMQRYIRCILLQLAFEVAASSWRDLLKGGTTEMELFCGSGRDWLCVCVCVCASNFVVHKCCLFCSRSWQAI